MKSGDIIELVKHLNDKGIRLTAQYEPVGCEFCLKASDVPAFLADRIGFFASECGLTREQYIEWREYVKAGCLCGAKTKKGTCVRPVKNANGLSPHEYYERKKIGDLVCARHVSLP